VVGRAAFGCLAALETDVPAVMDVTPQKGDFILDGRHLVEVFLY